MSGLALSYGAPPAERPEPTSSWLARTFRRWAKRLDGGPAVAPTLRDVAAFQLAQARALLMEEEAELERATHACNMLRDRILRLEAMAGEELG